MNKKVIGLIIFLIILIGGFAFLYFKIILPNRETGINTANLSISAEYEGEKVQTNLLVNQIELNISRSYEIITVPLNQTTTIKNINKEGQYFYEKEITINITKNERYDLILERPSEIKISSDYSKPINIKIEAELENPFICVKYSPAYIFVEIENQTLREKPSRYQYWDKCYSLETYQLKLDYEVFNPPKEEDFINISVGIENFEDLDKIFKIK